MRKPYLVNNKKIIYIIDNLLIGGAQKHLLSLAPAINNNEFPVKIVCLGKNNGDITKNINLPIYYLNMDCVWKLSFWLSFISIIRIIMKEKPAIVHTYLNTSNVFGVLAAKVAGVPIIITSRRDAGHFRSKIIGILERISAQLSDIIVCVSKAIRDKVIQKEKISIDKTMVIYNGVDTNVFKKKNDDSNGSFNISMIATMNRKIKGHFYFIKAAEEIIRKRNDVRFTLVGDGYLKPALENYINSKNVNKYFNFRGDRTNLIEELKNTDILIVPSESEGCSNALLEAMAMGIPAIATAVEGNLEVIEDGISGFLVKHGDSSFIAEKISNLLSLPTKIKEAGIEARKTILEKFTLDKMVNNYIALYKILSKSKANA